VTDKNPKEETIIEERLDKNPKLDPTTKSDPLPTDPEPTLEETPSNEDESDLLPDPNSSGTIIPEVGSADYNRLHAR
jgi:hypothetical protein